MEESALLCHLERHHRPGAHHQLGRSLLGDSHQAVAVHPQQVVPGLQPPVLPGGPALHHGLDVDAELLVPVTLGRHDRQPHPVTLAQADGENLGLPGQLCLLGSSLAAVRNLPGVEGGLAELAGAAGCRGEGRRGVQVDGPEPAAGGLRGHEAEAVSLQGIDELHQTAGDPPDDVTAVVVLGQQEGQLEDKVFLQSDLPSLLLRQLVHGVARHPHDGLDQLATDGSLVFCRLVARQQSLQLEGVEFEAGGGEGGDVLRRALAGLQQVGGLGDPRQVAVCRQLQALLLRPDLHLGQPPLDPQAPGVGAVVDPPLAELLVRHDGVEGPHVDKVEELGEELDGEGSVDPTLPEETHGGAEDGDDPRGALVRLPVILRQKVGQRHLQVRLQGDHQLLECEVNGVRQDVLGLQGECSDVAV